MLINAGAHFHNRTIYAETLRRAAETIKRSAFYTHKRRPNGGGEEAGIIVVRNTVEGHPNFEAAKGPLTPRAFTAQHKKLMVGKFKEWYGEFAAFNELLEGDLFLGSLKNAFLLDVDTATRLRPDRHSDYLHYPASHSAVWHWNDLLLTLLTEIAESEEARRRRRGIDHASSNISTTTTTTRGSAEGTKAIGQFGTTDFELLFTQGSDHFLSPWHDLPLVASAGSSGSSGHGAGSESLYTFVVEIPMYETAKMEVSKTDVYNPIKPDTNKDGSPRHYTYGKPFFNYGLLPQTWEDPANCKPSQSPGGGTECGDDDPLDVVEFGDGPLAMGSVTPVKVLGALELIDEGETDYKILTIRASDKDAARIHDVASLEAAKPGTVARLVGWLKKYKTAEGKGLNSLASDTPAGLAETLAIIAEW